MTEQNTSASTLSTPSDLEIVMTRVFDAPRALVFEAYTDPRHVPHWWGLRGNTTIVDKMDVRPGGQWRYIREVAPPERLVSTFEFEGMPGHIAVDAAQFDERDGKTTLTVTSTFTTKEERDGMLQSGMEGGANETWDRLAELLARLQAAR